MKNRSLAALLAIQLLCLCERQKLSSEAIRSKSTTNVIILLHCLWYAAVAPNGLQVNLMGADVDNDGYIAFDSLVSEEKIMCMTNCAPDNCSRNWYFPNGSAVSNRNGSGYPPYFARNRGEDVVRLFRVDDSTTMASPPQRGRFYCEVSNNHDNTSQRYYVNICTLVD